MKLSTLRVGRIFNAGSQHETDPEGEIERLLGEYFDELAAKHCAAGPWRFDVENAPKDGSDVIIAWRLPQFGKDPRPIYQNYASWNGRRFGFRDVGIDPEYIVAFAIPNPPQVASAKPKEKL